MGKQTNGQMGLASEYQRQSMQFGKEEMSLLKFLEGCKEDPSFYASAHERLITAIGKPELVDTGKDDVLGRIFSNRIIRRYPAFEDGFFGMEIVIENIVSFLTRAAQGLHEKKSILYLLGPVGGGKSSLLERLKELFEREPFFALKANDEISPIFESPLGLFSPQNQHNILVDRFGIPVRKIPVTMSPWAKKRLDEFDGDIEKFTVVKLFPSVLDQIGIAVTDPGDENNQDVSALVGKTDIRKLEEFSQNDPDSYSFSGGLCLACQGFLEFREMFKAPIKTLNPLLFATQEGNYKGTEGISAIPFNGIVIAHSNESEWVAFKGNNRNEAFIDRIHLVKVPYVLRVSEEVKIYRKLINESELAEKPLAPDTLKMLARFSVLSRFKKFDAESESKNGSSWCAKMRVYDGERIKDTHPNAKSLQEYRDAAGIDEGMNGISTRFAFKVLARTFNFDPEEIAANPVHLLFILGEAIKAEQFTEEIENLLIGTFLKDIVTVEFREELEKIIRSAFVESYAEVGQNIFDRYIQYADFWCDDKDFRDPDTGAMFKVEQLNIDLEKIEKPAGIGNPKDFRNEVVKYALKYKASNDGKMLPWDSYEKMREVVEKRMFANVEDLIPVISFEKKRSEEEEEKHKGFVDRMTAKGFTEKQVRTLVDWHLRVKKSD